jgi:hypothetical protein
VAIARTTYTAGTLTDQVGNATSGTLTSYSFDPAGGDFVVLALGGWRSSAATMSFTASVGGVAATPLGSMQYGGDNPIYNAFFQFLVVQGVTTGLKTIAGSWAASANSVPHIRMAALAYSGVASYGGLQSTGGTESGTTVSQTVNTATNDMIVQMFMHEPLSGGTMSGYNQTSLVDPYDCGTHAQGILGQAAAGGSTVTFTAVRGSAAHYLETAFNLIPSGSGPAPTKSNMFLVM